MKKTKKALVLTSALATTALCASLVTGATFALFTSESNVDIAVTAGKVAVTATVDQATLQTYSMGVEQTAGEFQNGGTAGFTGTAALELKKVTPGDEAKFNIVVTNDSNVNVKYAIEWTVKGELADALQTNVVGAPNGLWAPWTGNKTKTLNVSVKLPEEVGNEYQDKSADIQFVVKAIQGNAQTVNNLVEGYYFDSADEAVNFCPDCRQGVTCKGHEGNYLNIAGGKATIIKKSGEGEEQRGLYMEWKDLDWANNYYRLTYDVDLSALPAGEAIVFDHGECATWQDLRLGFTKKDGKYVAYEGIDAYAEAVKDYGEVGKNVTVTVTYYKVDGKLNMSLALSGLGVVKTNKEVNTGADKVCWDVYYTSSEEVSGKVTLDNVEFAELNGKFVNAANATPQSNTVIILNEDVQTLTIPNGVQNAVVDGKGKTVNQVVFAQGANSTVTVKNAKFVGTSDQTAITLDGGNTGKLTLVDCTIDGYVKGVQVSGDNTGMSLELDRCVFNMTTVTKSYGFQGFGNYDNVIIKNCEFNNCVSWAIIIQGLEGNLVFDGNKFTNCQSGIYKTTGTVENFVFTNNTLTNCQGHDGNTAEFFVGTFTNSTVTGNTLDGNEFNGNY